MLYIFCSHKKKTGFLIKSIAVLFVVICFAVYSKQELQIDNWFFNLLETSTNSQINFIFQTIYISGDIYVAGPVVAIALGWMIWRNYKQEAISFAFATSGILILIDRVLKPFFDRNRPPKPRLVGGLSRHSFPSGHAAGNLVLYFYLSFIIAVKYPQLRVYVYAVATTIVIAIGFASLYTKAHWLTDILGGYLFGYLWLIVSLNLLKFNQRNSDKKKQLK